MTEFLCQHCHAYVLPKDFTKHLCTGKVTTKWMCCTCNDEMNIHFALKHFHKDAPSELYMRLGEKAKQAYLQKSSEAGNQFTQEIVPYESDNYFENYYVIGAESQKKSDTKDQKQRNSIITSSPDNKRKDNSIPVVSNKRSSVKKVIKFPQRICENNRNSFERIRTLTFPIESGFKPNKNRKEFSYPDFNLSKDIFKNVPDPKDYPSFVKLEDLKNLEFTDYPDVDFFMTGLKPVRVRSDQTEKSDRMINYPFNEISKKHHTTNIGRQRSEFSITPDEIAENNINFELYRERHLFGPADASRIFLDYMKGTMPVKLDIPKHKPFSIFLNSECSKNDFYHSFKDKLEIHLFERSLMLEDPVTFDEKEVFSLSECKNVSAIVKLRNPVPSTFNIAKCQSKAKVYTETPDRAAFKSSQATPTNDKKSQPIAMGRSYAFAEQVDLKKKTIVVENENRLAITPILEDYCQDADLVEQDEIVRKIRRLVLPKNIHELSRVFWDGLLELDDSILSRLFAEMSEEPVEIKTAYNFATPPLLTDASRTPFMQLSGQIPLSSSQEITIAKPLEDEKPNKIKRMTCKQELRGPLNTIEVLTLYKFMIANNVFFDYFNSLVPTSKAYYPADVTSSRHPVTFGYYNKLKRQYRKRVACQTLLSDYLPTEYLVSDKKRQKKFEEYVSEVTTQTQSSAGEYSNTTGSCNKFFNETLLDLSFPSAKLAQQDITDINNQSVQTSATQELENTAKLERSKNAKYVMTSFYTDVTDKLNNAESNVFSENKFDLQKKNILSPKTDKTILEIKDCADSQIHANKADIVEKKKETLEEIKKDSRSRLQSELVDVTNLEYDNLICIVSSNDQPNDYIQKDKYIVKNSGNKNDIYINYYFDSESSDSLNDEDLIVSECSDDNLDNNEIN